MPTPSPWEASAVEAVGDGRYRAEIGEDWQLAVAPQGGIVAAVAARAMAAGLAAARPEAAVDQRLRSIHGVFASPVPCGPVEIDVRVLRAGRSASQVQATLHAPGADAGFTALAIFGGTRPGFEFTELRYPEVPDPEGQRSFRDPLPPEAGAVEPIRFPFWERVVEGRPALGHAFWDPTPRTEAVAASWFRFDDPPIGADGRLDPLSQLVLVDVMPGAVFERVSPTEDRWFAPSADLTVHLFGAATPGWLLAHFTAHRAGEGWASVDAALWDPRGPDGPELVAWATQQMLFTRLG